MSLLIVKKEYHNLVPRPLDTEYNSLKNSIIQDGQKIPIVVNKDGVILDGHTRFQICNELKIKPIYETKSFDDPLNEKNYVIISNLSRRHLTLPQRAELLYSWWLKEKADSKRKGGLEMWKSRRKGIKQPPKKSHGKLAKRLGEMLGCSGSTAQALMSIFTKSDKETIAKLRTGDISISDAYNKVYGRKLKPVRVRYPKLYKSNLLLKQKTCLLCKKKTKVTVKEECHVHDRLCCTSCEWGI